MLVHLSENVEQPFLALVVSTVTHFVFTVWQTIGQFPSICRKEHAVLCPWRHDRWDCKLLSNGT